MKDENKEAAAQKKSPTSGMTLWQRIEHVGGRINSQKYVEFGSVMAVNALIRHVLRDIKPGLKAALEAELAAAAKNQQET
ncbi:hypothetical protein AXE65_12025 [Ventosimonas gracilis]|uniref:Uncharacterized protein n=2 Tax=Ventosimonas gracilis TaxID=1680762 RepID=A0A139SW90_9GAMM|nr:hypothetical protein AXE65_12025 [Ventosimonas gracilis]